MSYAALALAKKIFGELKGLHVLILGAGEMAKLTGIHLQAQQVAGRHAAAEAELHVAEAGPAPDLGGVDVHDEAQGGIGLVQSAVGERLGELLEVAPGAHNRHEGAAPQGRRGSRIQSPSPCDGRERMRICCH